MLDLAPIMLMLVASSPPDSSGSSPELEVKVAAIFEDSCTMCHDASDDVINLESSLDSLINKPASTGRPMIVPGDAKASYLPQKLVAASGIEGEPMPMDEDPLPADQIAAVEAWINAMPSEEVPATVAGSTSATASGMPDSTGSADNVEAPTTDTSPSDTPGTSATTSEDVETRRPGRPGFHGTHQIALQTTTTLGQKVAEFRVHHRFGLARGKRSYAGLAGGAVISLGGGYGIMEGWDALLRFSTSMVDWELGTKFVPIRQENGAPVSVGAYASFEFLTGIEGTVANRYTGNGHLMISRFWANRLATQFNVGYSSHTNHSPTVAFDFGNGEQEAVDTRGTLNAGIASTFFVDKKRRWGIDAEYILPIPIAGSGVSPFYYNGGELDPSAPNIGTWALGFSAKAGLHLFQVFATNTRNIHTNLVAPGGDTTNPFSPFGSYFAGFNLSRKWK